MDLAEACLVRLSEIHADCVLVTADSEFRDVYRRYGRRATPTSIIWAEYPARSAKVNEGRRAGFPGLSFGVLAGR